MYDLVVIGGGSAGRSVAAAAAKVGARVALVEKDLAEGKRFPPVCWPSKGLVQAARLAHELKDTARLGVSAGTPFVDFAAVMSHVRALARTLADRETAESLSQGGVEVHHGTAA